MTTHASQRAAERSGIELAHDDLVQIAKKVRAGGAIRLTDIGARRHKRRRNSKGTERWLVTWKGKALRVVFNPAFPDPTSIITVLTPLGSAPRAAVERRAKGRLSLFRNTPH